MNRYLVFTDCFFSRLSTTKIITHVNISIKNYEVDYDKHSHDEYAYEDGAVQINGHPQSQPQHPTWNQGHHFAQGDYTYTSLGTEKSTETNDFSTDEYESKPYPQGNNNHVEYNRGGGQGDSQTYGDLNTRKPFQVSKLVHHSSFAKVTIESQVCFILHLI